MATRAPSPPKRGWTILLVPPHPSGRTRTLRVRLGRVKVVGAMAALSAALFGFWVVGDTLDATATADQLAQAQRMILALSDSLRVARDSAATATSIAAAPAAQAGSPRAAVAMRPRHLGERMGLAQPAAGVVLPVIGEITSRFARSRFHPLLNIFRPHLGVDVSAPAGTDITAPAPGRVSFVGRKLGDGLTVEIDHGSRVVTRYAHCRSVVVHAGDIVTSGEVIAKVGSSGLSTGPHVHFEVRVNGRPVDPLRYLIAPRRQQAAVPVADVRTTGGLQ